MALISTKKNMENSDDWTFSVVCGLLKIKSKAYIYENIFKMS